jgi:hypothetical protein
MPLQSLNPISVGAPSAGHAVMLPSMHKIPRSGPGSPSSTPFQLTPTLIDGTTAPSFVATRLRLDVQPNLAAGTQWTLYQVDRPTILVSLQADNLYAGVSDGPIIYYAWGRKPTRFAEAQHAEHGGICFLSNPGPWWLLLVGQDSAGVSSAVSFVDLVAIDAWNPGVAMKWLSEPGPNAIIQANIHLASIAASAQVVGPNRGRIALTIQNVPPAGSAGLAVRISVNQAAGYLDALGVGIQLPIGSSMTFQADSLCRGSIRAIIDAAAAGAGTNIERLEYWAFNGQATPW